MCRYTEDKLNGRYHLRVVHLHPGNTSSNQLKKFGKTNAKYVTIAKIFDDNRDWLEPIGVGVAACSAKDNPTRKLGRAIAVGRAMQQAGV